MTTTTTWADLFRPGDATNFFDPLPSKPFNPESTAFDGVNAWWLAELSRLVYRDKDDRKQFLAQVGLEEVAFFTGGHDTQAFLVAPASKVWAALVFRGTSTPADFLTDAEVRMDRCGDHGRAHCGFLRGIDAVWTEAEKQLNELPPACRLFFAGHSLGAALATLAASRKKPATTYTFGSPRVGNRSFIAGVDAAHTFRVVDHHDVVARVPLPLLFLFGYRHVGELHMLEHERHRSVRGTARKLLAMLQEPPDPLADHAPINYVDRIGATIGFPPRTGRQ
jgi:hypothetical protein